jgi:uncharacterized hydrophobic protein (TIGR00271 family)
VAAGYDKLRVVLEPWENDPRVHAKVVSAPDIIEGILKEAALDYDLLLIGGSNESYVDRVLFGSVPQAVAAQAQLPTIIVRRRRGAVRIVLRQAERWVLGLRGEISPDEQVEAYREVRRGARGGTDFYVLIALASAIAALGLLMDSPTVIIGAMIIAPLMSAIFGLSMGIVQGDTRLLLRALGTTLRGAGLSMAIGALIGWLAPSVPVTAEIIARTQPTLMDLLVALLSGTAGAYAQCRRGVLGAVAGVAIAVALVPPLVTAGLGLLIGAGPGTGAGLLPNREALALSASALLLFLTNLSAITAAGSLVFLSFGFRPDPGKRVQVFGRSVVAVLLLLLAVSIPLTLLSLNAFRTSVLRADVQATLVEAVGQMDGIELESWHVADEVEGVLHLDVEISGPEPLTDAQGRALQAQIEGKIGRPVLLQLATVSETRWSSGP